MTKRKYYSVLAKPPGQLWSQQFGDYDKETAHDEMRDMKDHVGDDCSWEKGTKFKVIVTGDRGKDIIEALNKINAEPKEDIITAQTYDDNIGK